MIVFGPANAKHTITVFTDFDCPWCRRLHSQIAEYNKLGIRVRYMFFPRTGPHTESWAKAEAVWCAEDRKATFTRAKLGEAYCEACGLHRHAGGTRIRTGTTSSAYPERRAWSWSPAS